MLTSNSFSQTDTTEISLPTRTVRLIMKDLISGDNAKKEVVLLNDKVVLLGLKLVHKDSIITTLQQKIIELEEIVEIQDEQLDVSKELSNKLQQDLKKQKIKNKVFNLSTLGLIIIGSFVLISSN